MVSHIYFNSAFMKPLSQNTGLHPNASGMCLMRIPTPYTLEGAHPFLTL